MWSLKRAFCKPKKTDDEIERQRAKERARVKEDTRRRLHLLQAELDVMKRENY